MTRRLDEVDAGMHAVVDNVHTVDLVLGIEVCVEALFDVLHDRPPRVFVVDEIPEPGSIDYSEPQTHSILFDICADSLYVNGLGSKINIGPFAFSGWVERSIEKGVDEGGFPQTGFTCEGSVNLVG